MKIRKLKKLLKHSDGGSLKFKDKFRRKTYYFDISYEIAHPILKKMRKKHDFILLLSSNEEHKLFETMEDVQQFLNTTETISVGSIIELGYVFAVADRELSLKLFDNIMIPDQDEDYLSKKKPFFNTYFKYNPNISEGKSLQTKEKKSYSIFSPKKSVSKSRFDWNDAYLEGLRIHGNIDDAESHADDEKRKFKGF